MPDQIACSKHDMRMRFRQRRKQLDQRETRSHAICQHIIAHPSYQSASIIHCYLPVTTEVNTRPLLLDALSHHKRVVVPVVRPDTHDLSHVWMTSLSEEDLCPGVFGIPQPRVLHRVEPGIWQLVVVPLLAFDRQGYRLGYGKGFYDRLLAASTTPAIGAAFAVQEAERVPHDTHDIPLDSIVTEDEVIETYGKKQS